jgi:hypothetical protein
MPLGVVAVVVVALFSGCAAKDGAMTPKQRYDALFAEMRTAQERGYAETVVAVERAYARLFPERVFGDGWDYMDIVQRGEAQRLSDDGEMSEPVADHIYDVVAELGRELTGFRHDRTLVEGKHLPVYALSGST